MAVLPHSRGLHKPPVRPAALTKRALIALALQNTKAGSLRLSRAHLFRSTFDKISPAVPTFMASQRRSDLGGHQGTTEGRVFMQWPVALVLAGTGVSSTPTSFLLVKAYLL